MAGAPRQQGAVKAVSDATNAPVVIWDGGVWDFEEGVDFEAEGLGGLAEHLLVLSGGHDRAAEVLRAAERGHHRSEFDRLRACAHEHRDVAQFAPLSSFA